MSLEDCAALVERGDPDRFLAAMAAPPAARRVLFPLYAFNVEVSRAPWLTAEPMIAEMRLQWWRDVLGEIAAGTAVRRHEVTQPLALAIDAEATETLGALVDARSSDTENAPFASRAALDAYLDATGAGLMWTAARLLGAPAPAEAPVRRLGYATAMAGYLLAVPQLVALARRPLPPEVEIATLARDGQTALRDGRRGLSAVPRPARAALLAGWQAPPVLAQAARTPQAVEQGLAAPSEFSKRWRLMAAAATGRI